jgi:Mn2+/Fe2+ NRAMP family transporter
MIPPERVRCGVAGASFGYATLWSAPISLPMMTAVQYICARIWTDSGTGLAVVLSQRFPRPVVHLAVKRIGARVDEDVSFVGKPEDDR